MGEPGIKVVQQILPELKNSEQIDLVIAQSENVSDGKGLSPDDMQRLQKLGVDFFTGGNHTLANKKLFDLLKDNNQPVIGPANLIDCPGPGWKKIGVNGHNVLISSLLGNIVGKDAARPTENPLATIDKILAQQTAANKPIVIVNFHGDYSSEKVVIGHYLDGRAAAVIGDHWHVPTADARVLPGGTAHITDVGMSGALNSSLGVKYNKIIERWRDGVTNKNELETDGPMQFNAVIINIDETTGLATSIQSINKVLDFSISQL